MFLSEHGTLSSAALRLSICAFIYTCIEVAASGTPCSNSICLYTTIPLVVKIRISTLLCRILQIQGSNHQILLQQKNDDVLEI